MTETGLSLGTPHRMIEYLETVGSDAKQVDMGSLVQCGYLGSPRTDPRFLAVLRPFGFPTS